MIEKNREEKSSRALYRIKQGSLPEEMEKYSVAPIAHSLIGRLKKKEIGASNLPQDAYWSKAFASILHDVLYGQL